MNQQQYAYTQQRLVEAARILAGLPMQEFLEAIAQAHSTGPILDPTLYRDGAETMQGGERLARLALPFGEAVQDLQLTVIERLSRNRFPRAGWRDL